MSVQSLQTEAGNCCWQILALVFSSLKVDENIMVFGQNVMKLMGKFPRALLQRPAHTARSELEGGRPWRAHAGTLPWLASTTVLGGIGLEPEVKDLAT